MFSKPGKFSGVLGANNFQKRTVDLNFYKLPPNLSLSEKSGKMINYII